MRALEAYPDRSRRHLQEARHLGRGLLLQVAKHDDATVLGRQEPQCRHDVHPRLYRLGPVFDAFRAPDSRAEIRLPVALSLPVHGSVESDRPQPRTEQGRLRRVGRLIQACRTASWYTSSASCALASSPRSIRSTRRRSAWTRAANARDGMATGGTAPSAVGAAGRYISEGGKGFPRRLRSWWRESGVLGCGDRSTAARSSSPYMVRQAPSRDPPRCAKARPGRPLGSWHAPSRSTGGQGVGIGEARMGSGGVPGATGRFQARRSRATSPPACRPARCLGAAHAARGTGTGGRTRGTQREDDGTQVAT